MTFSISLQNFLQFIWLIVIALNLYVVWLFVRLCVLYRAERQIKLTAITNFQTTLDYMRSQYNAILTGCTALPPETQYSGVHLNGQLEMFKLRKVPHPPLANSIDAQLNQIWSSAAPSFTLDTNSSGCDGAYSQTQQEKDHTIFISDHLGRIVYEVPFREEDYMNALCKVVATQNSQNIRSH